jgi:hypothetical protein
VSGAGAVLGAAVPMPNAINMQTGIPGNGGAAGSAHMRIQFYDSVGPTNNAPIASIDTANGYAPTVLDANFTNGLYAVVSTPSTVQVTYN